MGDVPQPLAATDPAKAEVKSELPDESCPIESQSAQKAASNDTDFDPPKSPPHGPTQYFFTALLDMERKYGRQPFQWAELQHRYHRLFYETLTIDVLKRAFGGDSCVDIACVIGCRLEEILDPFDAFYSSNWPRWVVDASKKNEIETLYVRFTPTFTMGDEEVPARRSASVRSALDYAEFKRIQGFVAERGQTPPPSQASPHSVISRSSTEGSELQAETEEEDEVQIIPHETNGEEERPFPLALLQILLAMEKKFGDKPFLFRKVFMIYEEMFGKRLDVGTLRSLLNLSPEATLKQCLFTRLGHILKRPEERTISKTNPAMQFRFPPRVFSQKQSRESPENQIAWEYAVFKAQIPPTVPEQKALRSTLLEMLHAAEGRFENHTFFFKHLYNFYREKFGDRLTVETLRRLVNLRDEEGVRECLFTQLGEILEEVENLNTPEDNPAMRFRFPARSISHKDCRESDQKKIAWDYAVFKVRSSIVCPPPMPPLPSLPLKVTPIPPPLPTPPPPAPIVRAPPPVHTEQFDLPESAEGVKRFFTALLSMERKRNLDLFRWSEIEHQYRKLFNETLTTEMLVRVFQGNGAYDAPQHLIAGRLCGILHMFKTTQLERQLKNPRVKFLPYVRGNLSHASALLSERYNDFRKSRSFVQRKPPIVVAQDPPPHKAPPSQAPPPHKELPTRTPFQPITTHQTPPLLVPLHYQVPPPQAPIYHQTPQAPIPFHYHVPPPQVPLYGPPVPHAPAHFPVPHHFEAPYHHQENPYYYQDPYHYQDPNYFQAPPPFLAPFPAPPPFPAQPQFQPPPPPYTVNNPPAYGAQPPPRQGPPPEGTAQIQHRVKREAEEELGNVNDEPKIKKVKTEDDEGPKVKEEPKEPVEEMEKKVKAEEPDH